MRSIIAPINVTPCVIWMGAALGQIGVELSNDLVSVEVAQPLRSSTGDVGTKAHSTLSITYLAVSRTYLAVPG